MRLLARIPSKNVLTVLLYLTFFADAPITDYYVDTKTAKYKAKFEKVIEELGINRDEVTTWLKKKKIIE